MNIAPQVAYCLDQMLLLYTMYHDGFQWKDDMDLLPKCMAKINSLSVEQRGYLDRIWIESIEIEHGRWIECFDFYNWFDTKEDALSIIESIGGSFVHDGERGAGGKKAYSLTLIGILTCPSNEAKLANLVAILEHVRDISRNSNYPIRISDAEMCKIADITESDLNVVEQIFCRSYPISSLIRRANEFWIIEKQDIIMDLRSAISAAHFLDELAISDFRADMPAHHADRRKFYDSSATVERTELLHLIIRCLCLENVVFERMKRLARFRVIMFTILLTGTIGILLQVLLNTLVYSIIGFCTSAILLGVFLSVQIRFGNAIVRIERSNALTRYRKVLSSTITGFLSERDFYTKPISEIIAKLTINDIMQLTYYVQEIEDIVLDDLVTPPVVQEPSHE